jgi:hypothetical protein
MATLMHDDASSDVTSQVSSIQRRNQFVMDLTSMRRFVRLLLHNGSGGSR